LAQLTCTQERRTEELFTTKVNIPQVFQNREIPGDWRLQALFLCFKRAKRTSIG